MKTIYSLIVLLLGLTLTSFSQNAHYFKPWKSKVKFEKRDCNNIHTIYQVEKYAATDQGEKVVTCVLRKKRPA